MMNQTLTRKSATFIPCQMLYQAGGAAISSSSSKEPAGLSLKLEKDGWRRRELDEEEPRPQTLSYTADGPLPNSQGELDEDDEEHMDVQAASRGSTSPPDTPVTAGPPDALHLETRETLHCLFMEQAGARKAAHGSPKALDTLRRVGAEISDKHYMAFQGMLQKLSIQSAEDIQKLSEVPSMVFSDGKTNWGRIVTLISFGAFVAKYLKSIQMESCIHLLADNLTDYLMTEKKEWIVQHNGWDGCVEFFRVTDYEGGIRTVLMAFAGVAGLGVSLAYMIR
ncbi:induced myeloid leukemia cell differentiation protein Mcl-1 [Gastrophryne carolinensis]